jgi:hypothetical protein
MAAYKFKVIKGGKVYGEATTRAEAEAVAKKIGGTVAEAITAKAGNPRARGLTRATKQAIQAYGIEACRKAFDMHDRLGYGASGVSHECAATIRTTRQADAAINAGRELASIEAVTAKAGNPSGEPYHVAIGRRLLGLPGAKVKFFAQCESPKLLDNDDPVFEDCELSDPRASVYTHAIVGNFRGQDEDDQSTYNAESYGEETRSLAAQRKLVADRFGALSADRVANPAAPAFGPGFYPSLPSQIVEEMGVIMWQDGTEQEMTRSALRDFGKKGATEQHRIALALLSEAEKWCKKYQPAQLANFEKQKAKLDNVLSSPEGKDEFAAFNDQAKAAMRFALRFASGPDKTERAYLADRLMLRLQKELNAGAKASNPANPPLERANAAALLDTVKPGRPQVIHGVKVSRVGAGYSIDRMVLSRELAIQRLEQGGKAGKVGNPKAKKRPITQADGVLPWAMPYWGKEQIEEFNEQADMAEAMGDIEGQREALRKMLAAAKKYNSTLDAQIAQSLLNDTYKTANPKAKPSKTADTWEIMERERSAEVRAAHRAGAYVRESDGATICPTAAARAHMDEARRIAAKMATRFPANDANSQKGQQRNPKAKPAKVAYI